MYGEVVEAAFGVLVSLIIATILVFGALGIGVGILIGIWIG